MATFVFPQDDVTVTKEEFDLFHSIDRKLFVRLVHGLKRDPAETSQVMALWMWLEHNGKDSFNLIHKTLTTLPNPLLEALAEESVLALKCIQSDEFPYSDNDVIPELPLLQAISKSGVTLKFFYDNRLGITRGVTAFIRDICMRAFMDLYASAPRHEKNVNVPKIWDPEVRGSSLHRLARSFDPNDLLFQRQVLNMELEDVLSRLNLSDDDHVEDVDQEVAPDHRTIFLTFSKGYPITENEVREYFTRRFGDVVEAVYMQEVVSKQPLYARLVIRSGDSIPVILEGKTKAKFTINGKHVWARKYVRKAQPTTTTTTPVA